MTANLTDLTRVTATIACSGGATTNPVTNTTLRAALGYGASGLCTIGSSDGYYTQFAFRVDTTGGRTWDFAVDDTGDGTYTTLKTGLASGANVTIGLIPGAFSDGTVVGARRPFAFLVTLSSADASSVINITAMRVLPNDARMVATDLSSTNTAVAAIATTLGTPAGASVSADVASIESKVAVLGSSGYGSFGEDLDALIGYELGATIAIGTLDGVFVHTTTVVECSTLSGTVDYYGAGCRLILANNSDSGRKAIRTISSYSTANKRITVSAAFPWTPVNGDTFTVVPA